MKEAIMRHIIFSGLTLLFLLSLNTYVQGQNCKKFHLYGACMQYPGPKYKIDNQSRSNIIGIGDKLIYSIVFYGSRNYKLYFCVTNEFTPMHFTLRDSETGELIYDNKDDAYPETIHFNVENTRNIKIELSVLASNAPKDFVSGFLGCSGMLIYWRPVNL